MPSTVFSPLLKSVSILAVDDDPHQLNMYSSVLSEHELVRITTASSASQAEMFIKTRGENVHLCLLDLGIDDMNHDEFYLLKKYGGRIPFIIISGAKDMERAYKANSLGAAALLAKPVECLERKFWDTIKSVFCNQVIIPAITDDTHPAISKCCAVLRELQPASISDWAASCGITYSYLRRIWMDNYSIAPKYFHFLYILYQGAFIFFNKAFLALYNESINQPREPAYIENYRKIKYFLDNKKILKKIIDSQAKPFR